MALAPSLHSLVHSTAVTILQHDLPGLPEAVTQEVATFTVRRLGVLATHMRLGVAAIALFVRLFASIAGQPRLLWLSKTHLPLLGEYFRLIRSLSYAYIWEKWPDTRSDGSPV